MCKLYTFIDHAYLYEQTHVEVAQAIRDVGLVVLQLRAKSLPCDEIRRMAEEILPMTRGAGVNLVINDFPDIAHATGAQFCHLGQEDFFDAGYTKANQVLPV